MKDRACAGGGAVVDVDVEMSLVGMTCATVRMVGGLVGFCAAVEGVGAVASAGAGGGAEKVVCVW